MKKILFLACIFIFETATVAQIKTDTLVARKLYVKADSLLETGNYEPSLEDFQKASAIYRNYKLLLPYFLCRNKIVENLSLEGKFDEAELQIESDMKDPFFSQGNSGFSKALFLNVLGFVNLNKGRNDKALENFKEALSLLQEKYPGEASECYKNLGLAYWDNGNPELALEYHFKALAIRREKFGENHAKTAAAYNNIGLTYSVSEPDKALEYYRKALAIYQNLYKDTHHPSLAIAYNNIGIILRKKGDFNAALDNFEKVLSIWRSVYDVNHPNVAFTYSNIGQVFLDRNSLNKAFENLQLALEIYKKNFGEKHPEIANTCNLIGSVYEKQEKYKQALQQYQTALVANCPDFNSGDVYKNPSASSYYNPNLILASLSLKAQALENFHFHKTLKKRDLAMVLRTYETCDTLIDRIRQSRTSKTDKVALGTFAADIYENGIKTCLALADVSISKKAYMEKAFYFNEKNKSAVLLEAISDTQAKGFANVPDALQEDEKAIKAEIGFYELKLASKPEAKLEKLYRDKLFLLNRKYEKFVTELGKNFPEYYNLKFNINTATVKDIQHTLDERSALISYFTGENTGRMYIFMLTKRQYKLIDVAKETDFEKNIKGLRNAITFNNPEVFSKTAYALYQQLFPKHPGNNIQHIIIIPDGRLGTIPYEALLSKNIATKDIRNFSKAPFVIKRYGFSYTYSATLFKQAAAKPVGNELAKSAFLCAPVSFQAADKLSDLPGTAEEIGKIGKLFSEQKYAIRSYVGDNATEAVVKSDELKDFQYLHFATHGIVNETQPELSEIFLAKDKVKKEDGNLYSGEIYNLNIKADLVTLSACQTGLGKVTKGEGMIGLSRALLYAGAKNLVVSLWSVSDESTSMLMVDFYRNILKMNENKFTSSLRDAKLSLINDEKYANPYYWAPFVLIGK